MSSGVETFSNRIFLSVAFIGQKKLALIAEDVLFQRKSF